MLIFSNSSLEQQVSVFRYSIISFMFLEQAAEFIHIALVKQVQFFSCWFLVFLYWDWPTHLEKTIRMLAS